MFIPCVMFVVVSWISFLIDPLVSMCSCVLMLTLPGEGGAGKDVSPCHPLPGHHRHVQPGHVNIKKCIFNYHTTTKYAGTTPPLPAPTSSTLWRRSSWFASSPCSAQSWSMPLCWRSCSSTNWGCRAADLVASFCPHLHI